MIGSEIGHFRANGEDVRVTRWSDGTISIDVDWTTQFTRPQVEKLIILLKKALLTRPPKEDE